jgi:type II secretory pathway pseudopilin PulG
VIKSQRHQRNRGFGTIEAALVVALAGLLVVGLLVLNQMTRNQETRSERSVILERANVALIAYLFEHGSLPCPAADTSGFAPPTCSATANGYVPYQTLGLPEATTGQIRYTVHPYPKRGTGDVAPATGVGNYIDVLAMRPNQIQINQVHVVPATQFAAQPSKILQVCALLTAPRTAGTSVDPAYSLQIGASALQNTKASDSTQALNRTFAELAQDLDCPEQVASFARTPFNTLLSAQMLLLALADYQILLRLLQQSTTTDLINNATPLLVTGPAKVGAKVMNLLIEQGNCARADAPSCAGVPFAVVDLTTESIYEAFNAIKMIRYGFNEYYSAIDNVILSDQIMAGLAIQIDEIQRHAASGLLDSPYL